MALEFVPLSTQPRGDRIDGYPLWRELLNYAHLTMQTRYSHLFEKHEKVPRVNATRWVIPPSPQLLKIKTDTCQSTKV